MRITPLVLLAALALGAAPARAQMFGTFTGADPLPVNGRMVGIYLQTSENVAAVVSQLRLSFYPGIDFGFAGGFARQDFGVDESRTNIRVGGDMKFAVSQPSEKWPFGMAIDAALGIETGDEEIQRRGRLAPTEQPHATPLGWSRKARRRSRRHLPRERPPQRPPRQQQRPPPLRAPRSRAASTRLR